MIQKNIATNSILSELKQAVADERYAIIRVLELLRHVDEGQWYLDLGYSSLFDFCVRELSYAADAANRRISAMRMVREVPALKPAIKAGTLNLSVVT